MDTKFLRQVARVVDSEVGDAPFHITPSMYEMMARHIVEQAERAEMEADHTISVSGKDVEFHVGDTGDIVLWLSYRVDFLFPVKAAGPVKVVIVWVELSVDNPDWDGIEEGVPTTVKSDFNFYNLLSALEDVAAESF